MSTLYQNLAWSELKTQFHMREKSAYKGDFGHVLMVGGDHGMGGAVRLAGEAALRVGAGLVSVATRAEHRSLICASRPEIMCHAVKNAAELTVLMQKATVIVMGPGLGQSEWSRELFDFVLQTEKPLVVDADALNLLSEVPQKNPHWILTPHSGEAARLLHCNVTEVQSNRLASVKKLADQYDGVAVLKGAGTLIQFGDALPFRCDAGNPGMASGGMGDVLTGVISGLVAQHFSLFDAAKTGVLLHALAGDDAAKECGERGIVASDLFFYLRKWVNPKEV